MDIEKNINHKFCSVENVKKASQEALLNVLNKTQMQKVVEWREGSKK